VILRVAKTSLVFAIALFYTLVVFNNITDYNSNFQFVRHVLMMDSTFPNNAGMWRAINSPAIHTLFYVTVIAWEAVTTILCWWGGVRMARHLRATAIEFQQTKNVAIAGLTAGMLLWLVAFLTVGAEWFLMWQSATWNGQEAAGRGFVVVGIVLIFVVGREEEI